MPWQLFIILQPFPNAAQVILLRSLARTRQKTNAAVLNAYAFLIQFACGILLLPWFAAPNMHDAWHYLFWLLLIAITFGLANILIYKALEHLSAGSYAILGTSVSIFTMVTAWIFLAETFSLLVGIGAATLLIAIWCAVWLAKREESHLKQKGRNWRLGLLFTLLSALCGAAAITTEKYCLMHMSLSTYMVFGWGIQVLVSFGIAYILGRKDFVQLTHSRVLHYGTTAGIMRGAAAVLMIAAEAASKNVAIVSTVANARLMLIVLFGMVFLKERKFFWRKIILAALATASVSLMLWG